MSTWSGHTVVIVDDMPKVIDRLRNLYSEIGLEVVGVAHNGIEALTVIKEQQPDLVSLDIIMPEMDGIECYRKLRDGAEFSHKRPRMFFVTYLATEPKFLAAYREEIPEHLFVAKTYTAEPVRNTLDKLYAIAPVQEERNEDRAFTAQDDSVPPPPV